MSAFAPVPVDRRVLGGVVFADAVTGASIVSLLTVSNTAMRLRANHSGVYAILDAPGFSQYNADFDAPPAWPAAQPFQLTVQDPSLRYLGRRASVQAPQALASLAVPQRVVLYPGPGAATGTNWATVRASVTDGKGNGLPWAVLQVLRADNSVAATGMADARGEALLAVPGIGVQVSSGGGGAVTESTVAVTVQAWFDPSVLQQPPGWLPDPDDTLHALNNPALKTAKLAATLAAGQAVPAAITISPGT